MEENRINKTCEERLKITKILQKDITEGFEGTQFSENYEDDLFILMEFMDDIYIFRKFTPSSTPKCSRKNEEKEKNKQIEELRTAPSQHKIAMFAFLVT